MSYILVNGLVCDAFLNFAINNSNMDLSAAMVQNIILGAIFMFLIAIAWLLAEFKGMKDNINERMGINNEVIKLKLQALERFTLFAERSSLKNLVSRTPSAGTTVLDIQLTLLETLRTEYEYNVSQQIYIDPKMWKAIGNLKDQNIFIINQLAATLPSNANGIELCKRILDYVASTDADLSATVLQALQYEAKKIL
ncbi:MAG: hypothetical protein JST34_16035 [Bacteroidetes bacterium]|nr:hypothetical protein [Bacteroidota bacterium]